MSTSSVQAPQALGSVRVTLPRVLQSEWTKLWSLRSTRWSLFVACLAMAGLGPLFAAIAMSRWNQLSPGQRIAFDPIDRSLGGYFLAQLAIGVLGVMIITGEYSTGQIRSSLLAVPKRLPVLWAKLLVFFSVSFVLMLVTSLIAFFASQAIFTQHHVNQTLGSPDAFRVLIGTVLFMTVTGVLCTGLGTIIRSTAGSISAYVGVMFVVPGLSHVLPQSLYDSIHPYLPSTAGTGVTTVVPDSNTFSPWGGFALFCGYTVLTIAVGAYLLRRRDA